jgi:hypothetical protein
MNNNKHEVELIYYKIRLNNLLDFLFIEFLLPFSFKELVFIWLKFHE